VATISDVRVKLVGDSTRLNKALGRVREGMSKLGNIAKKVAKIASVSFAAIGAAAIASANTIEKARRKIVVGTGATGKALKGLQTIFKNLFVEIALPGDVIAETLANVQTISGLSGKSLETLTGQILKMSNIMGGDANNNALQFLRGLQAWQVPASEGTKILDQMFSTTQKSAISFEGLSSTLREFQPSLKLIGLTMGQSIDLLGRFSKGGLTARRVMPGLAQAIRVWSGENKNAGEELKKVIEFIKTTTDEQEGMNEAVRIFGADAGLKMFDQIRKGTIDLDNLGGSFDDATGSIDDAAEEGRLFTEEFTLIVRRLQLLLAPLGKLFTDAFVDQAVPAMTKWIETVKKEGPEATRQMIEGIAKLIRAAGPATVGVFNAFTISLKAIGLVMVAIGEAMQGVEVIINAIRFGRLDSRTQESLAAFNRIRESAARLKDSFEQDFADIANSQSAADAVAASVQKLADGLEQADLPKGPKEAAQAIRDMEVGIDGAKRALEKVSEEQKEIVDGTLMTVTNTEEIERKTSAFNNTIKVAGQTIKLGINDNFDKAIGQLRQMNIEAKKLAEQTSGAGG